MHWLPGDPVGAMLYEYAGDPSSAAKLREQLGLNDPVWVQFGRFLVGAARGDLGRSLTTSRPVIEEIATYLPNTLVLALVALLLATLLGVLGGIVAAIRRDGWIDQLVMLLSLVGVSMPIFWSGLLLILVFAVTLGWLPVTSGGQGIRGLIMPALSLAFSPAALIARLTRGSLLDILPQDYIRTAHAKGLRSHVVLVRHALRNALIPIVTVVGLQLGSLLSGTVVAETVFTRPGIGTLIITAIKQRDYLVVQGAVLYLSVLYVLVNLAVDLGYGFIDPRIRRAGA
jgi:ABC-type dipeptide/oligopeptide/nickel transport system permease component